MSIRGRSVLKLYYPRGPRVSKAFSMTWGRKPIFNPLSTTNFIRLCHFTRVRLWTVYNPNRSMLGLMLANALDLVYTCLDQIFNGRIFHRCSWFTRNCANSVPDCSILCFKSGSRACNWKVDFFKFLSVRRFARTSVYEVLERTIYGAQKKYFL